MMDPCTLQWSALRLRRAGSIRLAQNNIPGVKSMSQYPGLELGTYSFPQAEIGRD